MNNIRKSLAFAVLMAVVGVAAAAVDHFRLLPNVVAGLGLDPSTYVMIAIGGGLLTFDAQTIDATGAFFINQLTRLDPALNKPLADFTWARDVDVGDLDIGDENTAYDAVRYTAVGGIQPGGKSFIGPKATEIGNVGADYERKSNPTFVWAEAVQKTVIELAQAQKLGRDLNGDLLDAMNMKKNVDMQNQVYVGDTLQNVRGLVNALGVTAAGVANGASAQPFWVNKTDDEVLADVNGFLTSAWQQTGFTSMPRRVGIPPLKYSYLISRKIANGSMSLMRFLSENNIAANTNGAPLEFVPMKELVGAGAGGTDRMIAYTKNRANQRIPLSPMQSTPVQYRDLYQRVVYYCRVGTVEIVKPETIRYLDGF